MGSVAEAATPAPGYNAIRPNSKAPLPEILKLNGYSTAQFGKCHEVPPWENSPQGPFDRWPTGSGFEYFYGFVGGETNQYYPALTESTIPVEVVGYPAPQRWLFAQHAKSGTETESAQRAGDQQYRQREPDFADQ
jgi:arylsulfatase